MSGRAVLTADAKRVLAASLFDKGRAFLAASELLRSRITDEHESHLYVVLHLFCQGIECLLKGLLLWRNYDKYYARLRRLGHDLERLAKATSTEFGMNAPRGEVAGELATLGLWYRKHQLRYVGSLDILIAPASIHASHLRRRATAVARLARRHLTR